MIASAWVSMGFHISPVISLLQFAILGAFLRGDAWLEATNFPRQLWDLTSEELQLLRDEGRVQKQALLGQNKFHAGRVQREEVLS